MNKIPWFTHDHDAHMDLWLRAMIRKHGHEFHTFYWTLLELIHQHGVGGILQIEKRELCTVLQIHHHTLNAILKDPSTHAKWTLQEIGKDGSRIEVENKKFIERQRKLKSKYISMLPECSFNAPIEEEVELEGHMGIAVNRKLLTTETTTEQQPRRGQRPLYDPFRVFMDRIIVDFLAIKLEDKKAVSAAYRRFVRAGRDIFAFAGEDPDKAYAGVDAIAEYMQSKGLAWTFDTAAKWFPDWMNGGLNNAKEKNH